MVLEVCHLQGCQFCNRYRLLFGFEYRLILSMFYD